MKICRIFNFSTICVYSNIGLKKQYYKLEVICSGSVHSDGKIIDIYVINLHTTQILEELKTYKLLNDIIENPTLENVITWIYYRLVDKIPGVNLKLWVDDRTYVEWK